MPRLTEIGVVLVHYDHFPEVLETVAGCLRQGVPESQMVVVDNSGSPALRGALASRFPLVDVLDQQGNVGYAGAVNRGVKWARRRGLEWVLVVTHEVVLAPGCVAQLCESVNGDPAIAISAPIVYRKSDPHEVWSLGGDLDARSFSPSARLQWSTADPDWVDGCCFLLRVDAHSAVGGIYEPYFLYFEEIDFCVRLARAGYRVSVHQAARAYQEPGGMSFFLATRNRTLLARRLGGPRAAIRVAGVHLAKAILEPMRHPVTGWGKSRERVRATWEGLTVGSRISQHCDKWRFNQCLSNSRAIVKYILGPWPRRALVWIAAWASGAPRRLALRRIGVCNEGHVGRGVMFLNGSVRIGTGARIGRGCRFEGGAAIVVRPGVELAPNCLVTTTVNDDESISWDIPLRLEDSVLAPGSRITPVTVEMSAQ